MQRAFLKMLALAMLLYGVGSSVAASDGVRAYVNTNGMLKGYVVQKNGRTICRNPVVWNQFRGNTSYIVCEAEEPASEYVRARVNTNGILQGYVVQKNGRTVCRNPEAWLQFRGSVSYIVCD